MRFLIIFFLLAFPALAETRVIDGDTLDIDGTIYRLNGIDAPEHGQKCGRWRCGAAATDRLAELVNGAPVACEAISEDRYGRTIATCRAGGSDVAETLVSEGLAWAYRRFSDVYATQEDRAKAERVGIWAHDSKPAWEFRDGAWKGAEQVAPEGCPIKGNISRNGQIYHVPWSPWYKRTKINTAKGERWFCSEAEALQAGWRAPYWK